MGFIRYEGHAWPKSQSRSTARCARRTSSRALLLVHFLREQLNLTGTHVGCDTSQCGACTVLIDGRSAKSCTMFAVQADGSQVTTIEGLAKDGQLHPLQEGFWEEHGLQCGYCTPGMIMSAANLLAGQSRSRPSSRSAKAFPATSAAAPATSTSSTPFSTRRTRRKGGSHGDRPDASQAGWSARQAPRRSAPHPGPAAPTSTT